MKPSQNSLFKADTRVRSVAENGILGLVQCISNRIIAGGSSNRPEQVPESGPVIDENNNPDTAAVELPLSFEELLVPYSVTSYTCCSSGFMALAQWLSW